MVLQSHNTVNTVINTLNALINTLNAVINRTELQYTRLEATLLININTIHSMINNYLGQ